MRAPPAARVTATCPGMLQRTKPARNPANFAPDPRVPGAREHPKARCTRLIQLARVLLTPSQAPHNGVGCIH